MKRFLVSVPGWVFVHIEAPASDKITEENVNEALLEEFGKFIELDIRTLGTDEFEIVDEVD